MAIPPWADNRARIDGSEFERVVTELLGAVGRGLPGFRIEHQESLPTPDGLYKMDATVRFTQLGVDFLVLVECKDHARPIEREDVQVLADKLRAAGAHKALLFSTNGFQKGAIEYAKNHGVALVRVFEGALRYETRGFNTIGPRPVPPPWANTPAFVGQCISLGDNGEVRTAIVGREKPEELIKFLNST